MRLLAQLALLTMGGLFARPDNKMECLVQRQFQLPRRRLNPKTPIDEQTALLRPSAEPLEAYQVASLVNSPRNETPACIEPINSAKN
jgi:putative SOS response-associated peptidase YedK